METQRSKQASVFMWILVSGLFSHNFVIPVMSTTPFEDQKTYYSPPDPHAGTPPTGTHYPPSHGPPSHGHHGPPSHGGNCGTPPTTPHGGYGNPPTPHGGTPHYDPPTPHHDPPTPHHDPPTPHHDPPTPHHDPPTPSVPTGGGYYPSPPTGGSGTPPVSISPPTIPIDPGTPSIPTPSVPTPSVPTPSVPSSPPFVFDPHTPFTGTCYFWSTHPTAIWGLIGWFGTLGGTFGATSFPGSTPTLSLPQALSNTRTDGYGALYREGTASLLNSLVNQRFPYTTTHVRDSFLAALGSNKAASAQAQLFKMANEGRLKPRA